MGQGIFVTGTGTEVGKTVIVAALLRYFRELRAEAVTMKPVQTGATGPSDELRSPDLEVHWRVAGAQPPADLLAEMTPYRFSAACSPHLAARQAGQTVDLAHIIDCAKRLRERYDIVIAEGVGGVMTPLNEQQTVLDLMKRLRWPVLLVSHAGLGAINHTLLSIEVLRAAGVCVVGVIFNESKPVGTPEVKEDNPRAVAQFGNVPVLGQVPYQRSLTLSRSEAWERVEGHLPGLPTILDAILLP